MKKIFCLVMIFAIIFSFTGCEYYEGMRKVNITTYENEIFNGMQNHETYNGVRVYASTVKVSYYENLNRDDFATNLNIIIKEGHDFIWCIENGGKDAVLNEAKNNPEVNFGLIDEKVDNLPSNVVCVSYRDYEGGFLAGYAAAKSTKSGIVGFLGVDNNEISNLYEIGFIAGINYALKSMDTPCYVETFKVQSNSDREAGKAGALYLYNEKGCDIVFHALQAGSLGALEAAKEVDKFIIGNFIDQSSDAHENVLCSIMKNTKITMNNIINMYIEKTLEFGKTYEYGVKERMISLSKANKFMDRAVAIELDKLRDDIADGVIIVPETYEELTNYINSLQ